MAFLERHVRVVAIGGMSLILGISVGQLSLSADSKPFIRAAKLALGAVFPPAALLDIQGNISALGLTSPAVQVAVSEHQENGYNAVAITSNREPGGGGALRSALSATQFSSGAENLEQIVGITSIGHVTARSGTAYGANPVAIVDADAESSAQAIGQEIDVEARRDIATKIGQQIVDVNDSRGRGNIIDAAIVVTQQKGSRGFDDGLHFGYAGINEDAWGIRAGGTLVNALPTSRSFRAGFDLSKITGRFTDCAICLPTGAGLKFGGAAAEGGSIVSGTTSNGMQLLFGDRQIILSRRGAAGVTVSDTGVVTAAAFKAALITPASSSAPCTPGQFSDDVSFHYVCVARNKWRRAVLSDF